MRDVIKNLYMLFDAAWDENMNGRDTDITRMVTTFVPDAIQDLQAYEYNAVILPHTIGEITFYDRTELFEWVENQQSINKRINQIYERNCT